LINPKVGDFLIKIISGNRVIRRISMIIGVQDDHRHCLDQLARPRIGQVDHSGEQHPSKIDKDGRRHYTIRAIHTKISSERLSG
jgi:hypothetical protein